MLSQNKNIKLSKESIHQGYTTKQSGQTKDIQPVELYNSSFESIKTLKANASGRLGATTTNAKTYHPTRTEKFCNNSNLQLSKYKSTSSTQASYNIENRSSDISYFTGLQYPSNNEFERISVSTTSEREFQFFENANENENFVNLNFKKQKMSHENIENTANACLETQSRNSERYQRILCKDNFIGLDIKRAHNDDYIYDELNGNIGSNYSTQYDNDKDLRTQKSNYPKQINTKTLNENDQISDHAQSNVHVGNGKQSYRDEDFKCFTCIERDRNLLSRTCPTIHKSTQRKHGIGYHKNTTTDER